MKRHIVIFTSQQSNSNSNKKERQDEVTSFHHIIVREFEDSDLEIEVAETPKTLEDGGKP